MPASTDLPRPAIDADDPESTPRRGVSEAIAAASRREIARLALALVFLIPVAALGAWRVSIFLREAPAILAHPHDLGYPESAVVYGSARLLDPETRAYPPMPAARLVNGPYGGQLDGFRGGVVLPYGPLSYALPAALVNASGLAAPSELAPYWRGGYESQEFDGGLARNAARVRVVGRAIAWIALALIAIGLFAAGWNSRPGHWSRVPQSAFGLALGLGLAMAFLDPLVRLSPRNVLAFRGDAPALLFGLLGAWFFHRAISEGASWRGERARPAIDEGRLAVALLFVCVATGFHQLATAGIVAGAAALFAIGRWRVAVAWLVGAFALAAAALAACHKVFGEHFLGHFFAMADCPWDASLPFRFMRRAPHVPILATLVVCGLAMNARSSAKARSAAVYLATFSLLYFAALAKAGASYNYLIPPGALALAHGVSLVGRGFGGWRRRELALACAILFAACWLPQVPKGRLAEPFPLRAERLAGEARQLDDLAAEVRRLSASGDWVVTDEASVDLRLGRAPLIPDPYDLTMRIGVGATHPDAHPFWTAPGSCIATRWLGAEGEAMDRQGRRYPFTPTRIQVFVRERGELEMESPMWRIFRMREGNWRQRSVR